MRRTTIFRSELTCAALVAAFAATAHAQGIQRPIQQAQRAAGQASQSANQANQQQPAPAAAPTAAPGDGRVIMTSPGADNTLVQQGQQAPGSHTVREGDTLWALAQQYLGDPLLWPEIYRLNTNVVEDPHWIYPGEELRITPEAGSVVSGEPANPPADSAVVVSQGMEVTPGARDSAQQNQQEVGPPPATSGPTVFSATNQRSTQQLQLAGARAYRAVREGEYYSSGFLTENQPIASGRLIGVVNTSTRGAIRTRTSAMLYEEVVVHPPAGETFAVNDLLLTYRRGDEIDVWGEMIVPTGLLKVKEQRGSYWVAEVIRVFTQINDNQELIKIAPFVNNSSVRAQPVTDGVQGRVLRLAKGTDVAQMQNVVFFDKGANEGLRLGDVLQVYLVRMDSVDRSNLEQDQARVIIVNTRPNTSTGVIVDLYRGDISSRSSFRQVRRMPS